MTERIKVSLDVAGQALLMTQAEVEQAVAKLPVSRRELLAAGPKDEGCGVCDALLDPCRGPAATRLLLFHANAPSPAREYERCLMIYRAAGWRKH